MKRAWMSVSGWLVCIVVLSLLCGLAFWINAKGQKELSGFVMVVGFIVGPILGVAQATIRSTYFVNASDLLLGSEDGLIIRVSHGKVIETGKRFWKDGDEEFYPFVLPSVFDNKMKCITATLTHKENRKLISVPITLRVHLNQQVGDLKGFDAQEVYKVVLLGGFRTIEEWLASAFEKNAMETPAIKQALLACKDPKNIFDDLEAFRDAISQVPVPQGLSNIDGIKAEVSLTLATYSAQIILL